MKKIVRLTEGELTNLIKEILIERAGVPDNITETAEEIFNEIIKNFSSQTQKYGPNDNPPSIQINGNFHISDYEFNKIVVFVTPKRYDGYNGEPQFMAFQVGSHQKVKNYRFVKSGNIKEFGINLVTVVADEWSFSDIADALNKDRKKTISVLSHELHHSYNRYKLPSMSPLTQTEYKAVQSIKLGEIEPLSDFLYYLYYTHRAEDLVRPSELYSMMRSKGITKNQFKSFFNENEMVQTLKKIRDFKVDDMIQDLYNYMPQLDRFFDFISQDPNFPIDFKAPTNDDEKVNTAMHLLFMILKESKLSLYNDFLISTLTPNDIAAALAASLFGRTTTSRSSVDQIQKMLEKYKHQINRFKTYMDFFVYEQKRINLVANERLHSLARLYDMAKDDVNESKDIVDWDLYHKINKTEEKTMKALKEMLQKMSLDDKEYPFLEKDKKKSNKKPSK